MRKNRLNKIINLDFNQKNNNKIFRHFPRKKLENYKANNKYYKTSLFKKNSKRII